MSLLDELTRTHHWVAYRHPHQVGSPLLLLDKVSFWYGRDAALLDLSLELQSGEQLAVVGPNGAGKSTLLKIIAGVLRPTQGEVHVYGHAPDRHICIAYVPQRTAVDWNFPVTVKDVVMMGRVGKIGFFRSPSRRDWEKVSQALEIVGIQDLANRSICALSGGQQQRMFLARALAQEAELILMDEPLSGLDSPAQEELLALLPALRQEGVALLFALHDLTLARRHFSKVLLLNRRLIALGMPEEVLQPHYLRRAYGEQLQIIPEQGEWLGLTDTCCES
ncbi:MAG: metal ABC transporter ATP-binding protein [Anaerolineales bacterium]|nr:metal ABC transporter ATP-binding protein [Anaerolineales bacterium]MCS7249235.1 metal ABC transporter ATP-binding protein [Anaerolineales bacterium]MDW8163049.1 metal ABC transporter ATP-binding protein [Anaerolineales bacterium]MDW8445673.1 metal ABC transporter ATP-binding protein [Anaerolineales bacterium]